MGARQVEVTLDDLWALDLSKLVEYKCVQQLSEAASVWVEDEVRCPACSSCAVRCLLLAARRGRLLPAACRLLRRALLPPRRFTEQPRLLRHHAEMGGAGGGRRLW
jgi:hypothetical protein